MGKAGDLFGHRRLFFAGVALTLATSIGAPFSHGLVTLVVWRVLQAVGNSTLSPNGIAIVRHHLQQAQGEAFATIAVANNGAAAVGPAVGGVLIHLFGWPAIFLAASGVYYLVRYLGTIIASAALSLALGDVPTMPGFHVLNLALLPIAALALAAGLLVPRGRVEPA